MVFKQQKARAPLTYQSVLRVSSRRNSSVELRAFVPRPFMHRFRGLAGQEFMPEGSAVVFDRCNAVHTMGMRFPIDVVFLDSLGRVVRVVSELQPRRLCGCLRGKRVVELPAGTAEQFGIGCGSRIDWDR